MYPHLTKIQKINYFHSLLREDALQANIEDSNKNSSDDIITIFKRCFGDHLSMAKARNEWDALKFVTSKQKLTRIPTYTSKKAKEAFAAEAQQFVVDKPYNDLVLHLERKMKLNGLGAPGELTLVPLNKIDTTQPQAKTKPTDSGIQNT